MQLNIVPTAINIVVEVNCSINAENRRKTVVGAVPNIAGGGQSLLTAACLSQLVNLDYFNLLKLNTCLCSTWGAEGTVFTIWVKPLSGKDTLHSELLKAAAISNTSWHLYCSYDSNTL